MRRFKRVIQIEMNEVSYDIVQKCIARGELPHFAKILKDWEYVETVSENKYEHIEPWIQWVTAHTGKPYAEHGIFHLSDVSALRHDQIWESLSDRGIESAIVGCMNASRGRAKNGLFFPDPWAKEGLTYPSQLQPLWDFISGQVQSHAVRNNSIQDMIRGVQTSLDRKIPMRLFAKVAQQFVRQKLNPQKKWMLAALFDEYIYALFENILSETRFGFNAAFFNAIAHYQHHYWRQHDSSGFSEKVSCPDCDRYDDPIAFGLRSYDRILSRVM
jgi:hypothetical protein